MQQELDADYPLLGIRLLGINVAGAEAGNPLISQGRDIPWLQDDTGSDVWGTWDVNWRDVVILDRDNIPVGVVNLDPPNGLEIAENYNALRQMLTDAASTAFPEPSTLGLSFLALLGLLCWHRKCR